MKETSTTEVERTPSIEKTAETVKLLEQFFENPENCYHYLFDGYVCDIANRDRSTDAAKELYRLVHDLDMLADCTLITSKGQPDFGMHKKLTELCGVRIVRGEYDSFGWLTGIIVAKNFRFVYG